MNAPVLRIVALLACAAATSAAQQSPAPAETLDEVTVAAPRDRERARIRVDIPVANNVTVRLDQKLGVSLGLARERPQVLFRRKSAARQLPEAGDLAWTNELTRLELLPDRIIPRKKPWTLQWAGYVLAADVDEADGVPANIPFGRGVALVDLDHVALRGSQVPTRVVVVDAMHPQTRQCEPTIGFLDSWAEDANPYVLVGDSSRSCNRAARSREGELLFAESVPEALRQVVRELYDPVASRLASRLGSEPGTMFVAWWKDSPHDSYRLELSWNHNSLLLFNGPGWGEPVDATQRDALRLSFMREQIQRRIREIDARGPFTQSAVDYLLLLTRSGYDHATRQALTRELPAWLASCDESIQQRQRAGNRGEAVASVECGLVLQFVYDAVARSASAGKEDIFSTWHKLLDASFRRGKTGATLAEFLASSAEARRLAQGLVDGSVDWREWTASVERVGVKLSTGDAGTRPAFEVLSLEGFSD